MKKYDVLVLNRLYIPISIIDYKRSISLLYKDHAHSLDKDFIPYDYDNWVELSKTPQINGDYYMISTINYRVATPDILVLTRYDKLPKKETKFSRENVFVRDRYKCAYCGKKHKKNVLTVDHVIPKSKGGKSSWKNIVTACRECNHTKADRTPEQAKMYLHYVPNEPKWYSTLSKMISLPNIRPSWIKFLEAIDIHCD